MERRSRDRQAIDQAMLVYDRADGRQIGKLVNLSPEGAMLVTERPVKVTTCFKCRMGLPNRIRGCDEFVFDAECVWSRRNIREDCWESGYQLAVTGRDVELIQYLLLSLKLDYPHINSMPTVRTLSPENRRESARHEFETNLPVFEHKSYRQIGELIDLSAQGARIIMRGPTNKGDRTRCRVQLPKPIFQNDYLVFDAECMWSCRDSDGNKFDTGCRIANISTQDEAILAYLLIHYGKPLGATRKKRVIR